MELKKEMTLVEMLLLGHNQEFTKKIIKICNAKRNKIYLTFLGDNFSFIQQEIKIDNFSELQKIKVNILAKVEFKILYKNCLSISINEYDIKRLEVYK